MCVKFLALMETSLSLGPELHKPLTGYQEDIGTSTIPREVGYPFGPPACTIALKSGLLCMRGSMKATVAEAHAELQTNICDVKTS